MNNANRLGGEPLYRLSGSTMSAEPSRNENIELSELWNALVRRRAVFFTIFAAFVGLVLILTLLMPKTYTTQVKLLTGHGTAAAPSGDTTLPVLNAILANQSGSTSETYVELLQEEPVAQQVIQKMGLHLSPRALLDRIAVKPITNTDILSVAVTWSNPKTSADIANTVAGVFVNRERDIIAGQASAAMDYLSQKLPTAQLAMRDAAVAMANFQSRNRIADISTQTQNQVNALGTLDAKISQANIDQQAAQAQLSSVTGQLAHTPQTYIGSQNIAANPITAQLQTQLAAVTVQLATAEQQYTSNYPAVIALKEQKTQLERQIAAQPRTIDSGNNIVPNPVYGQLKQQEATLRSQIAGDQAQISELRGQVQRQGVALKSLPAISMQYADLQRRQKLTDEVYTALARRYNDAAVSRDASLSDIAVAAPADPASASVRPDLRLNMLLGLVIGLIVALTSVFVVEFFDNSVKDERDAERSLALPVLTTVPRLTAATEKTFPWLRSMTVESFVQLVSALRYSTNKPLRTLAVTSPTPGDGKSSVALSSAIALSEIKPRILLVEGDMRRPALHQKLGLPMRPGLSEVLIGAETVWDAISETKHAGLDFLSCGACPPNPVKLLESAAFDEMLEHLREKYEMVIFDTPAMLATYDASTISSKIDGTLLVVAANKTNVRLARKAIERLNLIPTVNLLGMVINFAKPARTGAEYYLGYGKSMQLSG